jgi:hypothetical protein
MASGGGAFLLCFILYLDNVAAKCLKRSPTFIDIESRVSHRGDRPFHSPLESFTKIIEHLLDFLPGFLKSMIVWIVVLLGIFFCVLYCAARIYVVLESFISLRHVPIGVYQTPSGNFINYIPHL